MLREASSHEEISAGFWPGPAGLQLAVEQEQLEERATKTRHSERIGESCTHSARTALRLAGSLDTLKNTSFAPVAVSVIVRLNFDAVSGEAAGP